MTPKWHGTCSCFQETATKGSKQTDKRTHILPETNSSHHPKEETSTPTIHVSGAMLVSGRVNLLAKTEKTQPWTHKTQLQAWCCVHQQLGCPSSTDPEDFDCSALTESVWRSEQMGRTCFLLRC